MTKARKSRPPEQAQQSQTDNHRRTISELLLELADKCEGWSKETRSKLWGKTPPNGPAGENDEENEVDLWRTFLKATSRPWTEAHERLFCEAPGAAKELQSRYLNVVDFLQAPPYPSDPPENVATLAVIPLSGLTSLCRNVAQELKAKAKPDEPGQGGKTAGTGKGSQRKPKAKKPKVVHGKPRGRPRRYSDAKCKKAWKQFEDHYVKSNDATAAWNEVADNLDFTSGEAARKACERYRQSHISGQNGHN